MSTTLSIWGHHGTVEVKNCRFHGDAWNDVNGTLHLGNADDGPCILNINDESKGAWYNEHGFATDRIILDGLILDQVGSQTGSYLGPLESVEVIDVINSFAFDGTGTKIYFDLEKNHPSPRKQNGMLRISAAGTAPGALATYAGWPGANVSWWLWYRDKKISLTPKPAPFPSGTATETWNEISEGKKFVALQ